MAGWVLFILAATSVPLPGGGVLEGPLFLDGLLPADRVAHLGMYAVLGWLVVRALDAEGPSAVPTVLGGLLAAAVFAALDEWHQAWIPSRSPQAVDWLADVAGLAVGAGVRRLRTRRSGYGSGEDEQERGPQGE